MRCSVHTRVLQYAMIYKFKGHVYVVAQAMLPAGKPALTAAAAAITVVRSCVSAHL
jgi:hypothetical protein